MPGADGGAVPGRIGLGRVVTISDPSAGRFFAARGLTYTTGAKIGRGAGPRFSPWTANPRSFSTRRSDAPWKTTSSPGNLDVGGGAGAGAPAAEGAPGGAAPAAPADEGRRGRD